MVSLKEENPLISTWEESGIFHLDVRELLENGGEPYPYIMDCLQQLEPGQAVALHALFEPHPLIRQAQRLGFEASPIREEPDHWVVRFERPG